MITTHLLIRSFCSSYFTALSLQFALFQMINDHIIIERNYVQLLLSTIHFRGTAYFKRHLKTKTADHSSLLRQINQLWGENLIYCCLFVYHLVRNAMGTQEETAVSRYMPVSLSGVVSLRPNNLFFLLPVAKCTAFCYFWGSSSIVLISLFQFSHQLHISRMLAQQNGSQRKQTLPLWITSHLDSIDGHHVWANK